MDKLTQFFINIQAGTFKESQAYVSVILGAGYAGAFGLWNVAKGNLSPTQSNWIVICFGLSLAVFIGWTVYNNVWLLTQRLRYRQQLEGLVGQAMIDRYTALEKETLRASWRQMRAWAVVILICLLTATIGLAILLIACASALLQPR